MNAWPLAVQVSARDHELNTSFPPSDLEELVTFLSEAGYEAEIHHNEFGVGVDPVGLSTAVLLWVRDNVAADAAMALATLVAKWFRKRKPVAPRTIKVLYSPDGDVLAEVEVPD